MGHKCEFIDRVEIEEDVESQTRYLVRICEANYKDKYLDVYKAYESGGYYCDDRYYSRNLYYCSLGGYLVTFPGEPHMNYYYYGYYSERNVKQPIEDWGNTAICNLFCRNLADKNSINNIIEIHPEFKYTINKIKPEDRKLDLIMNLLEMWKQHPEIEGLCQLGLYRIALNKSLYKLTLEKRKQVIKFIMENSKNGKLNGAYTLVDIQKMMKYKIDFIEYDDFDYYRRYYKIGVDVYRWMLRKGYLNCADERSNVKLYKDYIKMAAKLRHDVEDPYWKTPSDLFKAHDKVMEEMDNIKATQTALQGQFLKVVSEPMAKKYDATVNGYKIFIPTDIPTIEKQCEVLYQCLLRNGYVNKVLMQEDILVFIWKGDTPVATAEISYKGELGQFYADERGHKEGLDCKPPQDVIDAFNIWFKSFKPIKAKAECKKHHWYKGFHSVEKGIYHTSYGNFNFEVGKTYATPFDDETIRHDGGNGCVATNKVFHFCESIGEISRHYNPTCYAEIEPLGPVVECDGAFLSNKIKIVRALSASEVKKIMAEEDLMKPVSLL